MGKMLDAHYEPLRLWTDTVKGIAKRYKAKVSQSGDTITIAYGKLGQGSVISQEIQDALIEEVETLNIKLIPSEQRLEVTAKAVM